MRTLRNRTVVLACLIVAVGHLGSAAQGPAAGTSGVPPAFELPLTALTSDAVVAVKGDRRLAASDDAAWVVDAAAGTVAKIDGKTNQLGTPVALGRAACGGALPAFKAVWVPLCDPPALARLEPELVKPPVPATATIRGAGALASAAGSLWMAMPAAGVLARIDPDTQRVVAEIPVAGGVTEVGVAGESLWVAGGTQATVTRVHAHTNLIGEVVTVGAGPVRLAAGEGAVWALGTGAGTVTRIDPATAKIAATVKLGRPAAGASVAAGGGGVWVSAPGTPLLRIDAASNAVTHVFTGDGGGSLATGGGALWLAATSDVVWRIDPKRVEATRQPRVPRVADDGVPVSTDGDPIYSTFSLCAIDPDTQQSGAAVTTRVPFVGRAVPHVRAGVGAVCTQASTRVENGREGLDLLAKGVAPADALAQLLAADPQRESRQVGIIDMQGRTAAHTGKQNGAWAGSKQGLHYTVQANIMVGPEVIEAVAQSFESTRGTGMPLAERMILAMEAGQAKGGDRRWGNLQSAAIKIADPNTPGRGGDNIALAIEVGEHPEPVAEMKRIYLTTARRLGYRSFSRIDGPDVVELKRMLHALGYWRPTLAEFPASANTREYGLFDDEAIAAVDKFREDKGLTYPGNPAGLVDGRFIDALRAAYFAKRKGG